ncbi:MAG: LysM peptidoglycan-binding domain-containing protein [Pseudomonadota bacterium]
MRTVLALVVLLVLAALVFFVIEPDDAEQNAEITTETSDVSGGDDDDGNTATTTGGDEGGETAASDAGADDASTAAQTSDTDENATTEDAASADATTEEQAGSDQVDTNQTDTDDGTETAALQDDTSGDMTGVEPVTPSFDIVRVETTGDAVMAGRASPGATVQIYSHDGLVAETTADDRGDWVIVLDEPLEAGSHELWLKSEDTNGTVSESRESVAMLVPEADDAPSDDGAASASGTASAGSDSAPTETSADDIDETIAVLVPRDDDGQVEILQEPEDGVGLAGGDGLSLDTLNYDEAGEVSLSGKAEAGAEIRAYVDGELVGRTLANSAGEWRMMLEKPVAEGLHALRIDQVDEGGTVLARVETPFDRESLQLPASAEPVVIIQPGNNLWTIARHSYGSGVHYTHIFEANQGQIADPHLIYPGQIFVLPTIN